MGKIDIRSVNFEDEDYEIYEKFTKRNRKQNFDEGNFHRGSLVEGERVTLLSLNEQKGVAEVSDPFDISWIIPIKFLLDTY